jgi:Family of unknown function (DUF6152)
MKKQLTALAAGALWLTGAATNASVALAHHSFAQFDSTKCAFIKGTVRTFAWNYPHSWLWVDVANKKGGVDTWGFEGEPPSNLAQSGWSKQSVRVGDKVVVGFNPLRDGRNGGAFSAVRLADGKLLTGALGKRLKCEPRDQ